MSSKKVWLDSKRLLEVRTRALQQLRAVDYTGGAVDIERVASNLGAAIKYAPYEGELAGMLIRTKGQAIIAINSAHHKNRQRFTIAHECGHIVFHSQDIFVDKTFSVLRRDEISSTAEDIMEVEANQFAAEILMPLPSLKRDLIKYNIDLEDDSQIAKMARNYSVSVQAMTYRVANLFLAQVAT
ncbi:ImmA/IrrE family metallo-endopeptidase [Mesorhizobium sp. M1348]|uniref:ImmA/IrrE family metallo-endopeptidase n=1 Tax=unclassified Mesorhizobium TaxID=325217 RepID=UPI00333526F7